MRAAEEHSVAEEEKKNQHESHGIRSFFAHTPVESRRQA